MIKLRTILSWLIIIVLFFLGILILIEMIFNPRRSIYNVSARSEIVDFTTLDDNLSRYVVYGASILNGDELISSHFDGSIQIFEGTQVTIQRPGNGGINITLDHLDGKIAGALYNINGTKVDTRNDSYLEIYIDSIEFKMTNGINHHFGIEGKTNIGKNIDHLNFYENPSMLHSGTVSILGRSYIGVNYYEASIRKLNIGDRIVFNYDVECKTKQDSLDEKGVGFVRIDDKFGMQVAYRRRAYNAMIFKPGPKTKESGYAISDSLLDRFKNDKLFKGLSWFIGFLVPLIAILTFIYDTHFFMKSRKITAVSENVPNESKERKKKDKKKKK
jgi:hypothetical protein